MKRKRNCTIEYQDTRAKNVKTVLQHRVVMISWLPFTFPYTLLLLFLLFILDCFVISGPLNWNADRSSWCLCLENTKSAFNVQEKGWSRHLKSSILIHFLKTETFLFSFLNKWAALYSLFLPNLARSISSSSFWHHHERRKNNMISS